MSIMKFALISDLHIDISQWQWSCLEQLDQDIDTVVVAGDISNDTWTNCHWLVQLRSRFNTVIWVAGNHDFYNLGFHKTRLTPSKEWQEKWPDPYLVDDIYDHYDRWSTANDIHFLHGSNFVHNGVNFVGATGWHDFVAGEPFTHELQIDVWNRYLNDSHHINWQRVARQDYQQPLGAARHDAHVIGELVKNSTVPCVIITHHLPHRSLSWLKPHDKIWTALHGSFVNTLLEDITDDHIRYWLYGHTHRRDMRNIGNITFVANPKGYPDENPSWAPIVLEI